MILDTNALSAWLDGEPTLRPVLMGAATLKLAAIVLGKYRFRIASSRRRAEYEDRLRTIEEELETLSVDLRTARIYATVRGQLKQKGRPIPYHDIWIAALGRQ